METEIIVLFATIGGFFLTIAGLFLWNRSESRSDFRALDNKIDTKIDNLIQAIQAETKEFHGRLCSLEAKQK